MDRTTQLILRSLVHGDLLVGDLPEASRLDRTSFCMPASATALDTNQKLGHLYEDALAALLDACPNYERLERNLQIHDEKGATLGEFDFLLRDRKSERVIHLELAVKFYLAVETDGGLVFPGPDARDNYHRKLSRLRQRQLTLGQTYRSFLPEPYRSQEIVARQLVYGCLFDPLGAEDRALPDYGASNMRRGRWAPVDMLTDGFSPETQYQIIPKPLWAVPFEWMTDVEFETWIPTSKVDRCVMLRVNRDPVPYFVTPENYPHHREF